MKKRQTITASVPVEAAHLQLLAVPEVAKLLSIGCTQVYALLKDRQLQSVQIGGSRRIPVNSIQDFIKGHMTVSQETNS